MSFFITHGFAAKWTWRPSQVLLWNRNFHIFGSDGLEARARGANWGGGSRRVLYHTVRIAVISWRSYNDGMQRWASIPICCCCSVLLKLLVCTTPDEQQHQQKNIIIRKKFAFGCQKFVNITCLCLRNQKFTWFVLALKAVCVDLEWIRSANYMFFQYFIFWILI